LWDRSDSGSASVQTAVAAAGCAQCALGQQGCQIRDSGEGIVGLDSCQKRDSRPIDNPALGSADWEALTGKC